MKRSEMIKLIYDFIQEIECDYDLYMNNIGDSEALLSKIEQAGMLPPRTMTKLGPDNAWDNEDE